jgi:hypothetical protein
MPPSSRPTGFLARRRAARRCRELDQQALREEFMLERPRGLLARLRAYAASVEDLERARVHASLWASRPRATAADAKPAGDAQPAPRALDPRS